MNVSFGKVFSALIAFMIMGIFSSEILTASQAVNQRVSEPGRYEGYSEPVYDGWQRNSVYVTVRDGTKIAMDIFRPTCRGRLHSEALPVIWEHRRYQRASQDESGRISSQ